MDPIIKAKWVKALRSGEYKQGREQLFDPEKQTHCCLGVLCRAAGVPLSYGKFEGVCSGEFIRMNDGEEKSFAEIADYIEQCL